MAEPEDGREGKESMNGMKEYTGEGKEKISKAVSDLILFCAERKASNFTATVQYGDMLVDVKFGFKRHKEG